jgi:hypothetical protein
MAKPHNPVAVADRRRSEHRAAAAAATEVLEAAEVEEEARRLLHRAERLQRILAHRGEGEFMAVVLGWPPPSSLEGNLSATVRALDRVRRHARDARSEGSGTRSPFRGPSAPRARLARQVQAALTDRANRLEASAAGIALGAAVVLSAAAASPRLPRAACACGLCS